MGIIYWEFICLLLGHSVHYYTYFVGNTDNFKDSVVYFWKILRFVCCYDVSLPKCIFQSFSKL